MAFACGIGGCPLKTALEVTKAKKRLKKQVGMTAAMKPFRAPGNRQRRALRKVG